MTQIQVEVSGYPPAKGEALSMLGASHSHAPRVRLLLEAARQAIEKGASPLGDSPIGLELVLRCSRDRNRSDATNYLGGVADVLEGKAHRSGQLDHLDELARVALYDNDRQIEVINYSWQSALEPSFTVTLWTLNPEVES